MQYISKLIQYAAMIVLVNRTGGDIISIVCGLALGVAAFYEGLVTKEERKGGGSEDGGHVCGLRKKLPPMQRMLPLRPEGIR